jgi:Ser/Thr protein kinase RdoA (MazF antagonist)
VRGNPRVTPVAGGFSGALVCQVRADDATFLLRQWPANALPLARQQELHRFLAFLQSRGVAEVAVPLASRDGTTHIEYEGRQWQLEPWMPGKADFRENPNDERLRNAMRALARLHNAAADYEATETGREWFFRSDTQPSPAVGERLQMIREWTTNRIRMVLATARDAGDADSPLSYGLVSDLLQQYAWVAPTIENELQSVANTPFLLHPCLRDLWHDHVLFTGNQVSGIIDPSAARTEHVASDLSRLLGSLLGDERPRWEFALDAYSQVRPLSDQERCLVRILDRSSVLLSGLGWIERRIEATGTYFRLTGIQSRVQEILDRLRVLAEEVDRL